MNAPLNRARCGRLAPALRRRRIAPPLATAALLAGAGCVNISEPTEATVPVQVVASELKGNNLAGMNLAGMNLAGMNLAGMNLGGPNMGGNNLAGMNMAGTNLSGTNMGGNNLAGMNMAATNLAGMNLAGMNLAGMNLAGMNLGASNLSGSNVAGTNLAGMNLAGMNLAGMNLAGMNTGYNMHNLGSVNGMLWSGEDVWMPKTNQRIVLGLGSTAFPKLLAQQSANARISVALGKLPWGFPSVAGGPITLDAWEAFVWGDKSYATFLLVAPPGSTWSGVAGFIKAVFRWNAPPTQSMDISGIEASAPHDPTLSTQVVTYTGMMNAGPKFIAGQIGETEFVAGLLAFVTATTNNQTVRVDFSSWVRDATGNGLILGNVESVDPPQYAEGVYHVYLNPDGTAAVSLSRLTVGSGLTSSDGDLALGYTAFKAGYGPKPLPIRCSGALYLNSLYAEPIPPGKCDSGLTWTESVAGYPSGMKQWSAVAGTTAPMNQFMYLPAGPGPFQREAGKTILSETYIFMWEPNHTLPASAVGGTAGQDRTSNGVATSNGTNCSVNDSPALAFNPMAASKWCATGAPSTSAPKSLMYMWGASVAINMYKITSAADFPNRDPKNWSFQGCNGSCTVGSDTGWVTLDSRSNQTFSARMQQKMIGFSNTVAYSQYRLRITANAGGDAYVQLRELQMMDNGVAPVPPAGVDRTENGTVTWTGRACSTLEQPTRAFDNLMSAAGATRWCVTSVPSVTRPVSIGYGWPVAPPAVTTYRITTSSDLAARDPKDWTLQGCDGSCKIGADDGWITLDTRSNQTFAARNATAAYDIASNVAAYAQYRLRVTANNGDATSLQIGEIQLF